MDVIYVSFMMLMRAARARVVQQPYDAFALLYIKVRAKLVHAYVVCFIHVCVCVRTEPLIRGLERYCEGPCPPLLCSPLYPG